VLATWYGNPQSTLADDLVIKRAAKQAMERRC
jgi:hypothetical protein